MAAQVCFDLISWTAMTPNLKFLRNANKYFLEFNDKQCGLFMI